MKKKKAIRISRITTLEEADAHQRKHGFPSLITARERQLEQVHGEVDLNQRKAKKLHDVKPREMNNTEREFSMFLAARKARGEILDYRFHAIKLVWGGTMIYTADFGVYNRHPRITVIEVKGAKIWDRDIVRFKGCKAEWLQWFDFEMHQRERGQWNRLL